MSSLARDVLSAVDDSVFERFGPLRVLFVAAAGYGFSCQAPVIRCLREHAGTRIHVTRDRDGVAPLEFSSAEDRALFEQLKIPAAAARIRKWHLVVYSHLSSFYPQRRALRAYMHHGPGFGGGGGTKPAESCELYFGLSEAEREYLEERTPALFGLKRAFFAVGFPKSDSLVNEPGMPSVARAIMGLPERKTVLLVSQWSPVGLLPALGAGPFQLLAERYADWNIIQTGHPWLWQSRNNIDADWQRQLLEDLRRVERAHPNAIFMPGVDAGDILRATDLLVADRTSVVTSFGLLDRPIVLFDNPARTESATRARQPYRDAAETFARIEDLLAACDAAVEDPQRQRAGRQRLRTLFFENPGKSAQVMADLIVRIGRVCSIRSPGWQHVLQLSKHPSLQSTDQGTNQRDKRN